MAAQQTRRTRSALKTSALLIYFIVVLLFLFVSIRTWVYVYDEGFALLNGERILRGDLPYRDFWTIYPPGQSYVLAAVFALFGHTMKAARVYDTLVRLLIVVGVYMVSQRVAGVPVALIAAALVTLWLGTVMFYAYAVFPALALALFALLGLIEYLRTGRLHRLAFSGALTGVTALFRIDIALYLGISVVLALSLSVHRSAGARCRSVLQPFAWFVGCAAAVAWPFYMYLLVAAGAERVWQALVLFPATTFRAVRHLPYPQLLPNFVLFSRSPREYARWGQFYLPLLIAVISALSLGMSRIRRRNAGWAANAEVSPDRAVVDHRPIDGVAITVWGVLLFAQALSRYDWIHALPAGIGALLTLSFLIGWLPWRNWRRWSPTAFAAAVALMAVSGVFLSVYIPQPIENLKAILQYASPFRCHSTLERSGCAVLNPNQAQAIAFIRAQTAPDEPIFVGNRRHDLLFVNDVAFYFLAGRPCATAYHELHPGVANTLSVQQTIADDIARHGVRWIVLVEWPPSTEPNGSAVSSEVTYLDNWIRAHYRPVTGWGEYMVWTRP